MVALEKVASRPAQGVVSVFKFGMAYGAAIAICERLGNWSTVTPQAWKKALGLSKDKAESLELARNLWPDAPLSRVKDNGRAEALLIAEWLRRGLE
jgi:crossover junction endodeoxyribonuclease RuvC